MASPILSNIYLHKLDEFVENTLIPEYTRGTVRARNRAYQEVTNAFNRARRRGDRVEARKLRRQWQSLPIGNPNDPGYRRLRYIRYADDHLLGFIGPKAEAEEIKQRLAQFLRDDLALELARDKTLITHARTGAARFLGYDITVNHNNQHHTNGARTANGAIQLRVPPTVIKAKCVPYLERGKPARRSHMTSHTDYDIVRIYGAEYRGIVQYYLLAGNVSRLQRLHWVSLTSMLKTLAVKHRTTVSKIAAKHKAKTSTPSGPRRCFEAIVQSGNSRPLVARFGGIPLIRQKAAVLDDRRPERVTYPRKELINRLLEGRCELCGSNGVMHVHHIRALAELAAPEPTQPQWNNVMAKRRRKTLVVCDACHDHIHQGTPAATRR